MNSAKETELIQSEYCVRLGGTFKPPLASLLKGTLQWVLIALCSKAESTLIQVRSAPSLSVPQIELMIR